MFSFIVRRLVQAVFTLLGVMLLTFVLFRLTTGDVSAQFVNPKLGKEARVDWLRKNKLDLPMVLNFQRRVVITDTTEGTGRFDVRNVEGARVTTALVVQRDVRDGEPTAIVLQADQLLTGETSLLELAQGEPWLARRRRKPAAATTQPASGPATRRATSGRAQSQPSTGPAETQPAPKPPAKPGLIFALRDGSEVTIDLSSLADPEHPDRPAPKATCGDLMKLVETQSDGRLKTDISELSFTNAFNSQFFWHLKHSVTFTSRSYKTKELLLDIIAKKARYSLAISVPLLVLGWFFAMAVSAVVAYYRASFIDKFGVFICVLGMCIPYLVYMIAGQMILFEIIPGAAWGLHNRANIFVPIGIALFAGIGGNVRFYRTVILDEINRDYVRTARAKGVSLPSILFKHVLKNCMLPILTSLVVSIPFLIMGSLMLERFFGVPGLGDLMVGSVTDRDVPIISGLTFLTAALYIVGLLVTDILYAVFDPRIRLK